MRRLRRLLARLLELLGVGRRVFHVDAGVTAHVTLAARDAATNAAVAGADVALEAGGKRFAVGTTDAAGAVDATVLVRWSYIAPVRATAPAPVPSATAVLEHPAYATLRLPASLEPLPPPGDVKELPLGSVSLAP